jgi:hypothetical protein
MNLSQVGKQLATGAESVGGRGALKGRQFEIMVKDFTQVEQAVPIRLSYGIVESAGVQMTPIFGFRSQAITTKAGK